MRRRWKLVSYVSALLVASAAGETGSVDLAPDYDLNVPPIPTEPGQTLHISVSLTLGSIYEIDEPKQMISLVFIPLS